MSNYRRLISYIYAYEGTVKGKNIGFAKLEARNGQCRISVSVKRVYVGGNDMGVYLLSDGGEILLGKIFIRSGAGEFRTMVKSDNVEESGKTLENCYGLTVHDVQDSWRAYTTIWDDGIARDAADAVAYAAEVELASVTSENLRRKKGEAQGEDSEMTTFQLLQTPPPEMCARPEETNQPAGLEAESRVETSGKGGKEEGAEENPGKAPRLEESGGTEKGELPLFSSAPERWNFGGMRNESQEMPGISRFIIRDRPVSGYMSGAGSVRQDASRLKAGTQAEFPGSSFPGSPFAGSPMASGSFSEKNVAGIIHETPASAAGTGPEIMPAPGMPSQPEATPQPEVQPPAPGMPSQPEVQPPVPGMPPQPEVQPPKPGMPPQPEVQPPKPGMPPQPEITPPPQVSPSRPGAVPPPQAAGQPGELAAGQQQPPAGTPQPEDSAQSQPSGEQLSPNSAAGSESSSQPEVALPEEPSEEPEGGGPLDPIPDAEAVWDSFRKQYPKIDAFDYENGCEILKIRPQDIGLLPRENWTYGNNSFLLHGYYNYRCLILVRLNNPSGKSRFLLGVPGHYFSNEKYMASMFGFPHFVLSKKQPLDNGRFGYWYTDVRLGQ